MRRILLALPLLLALPAQAQERAENLIGAAFTVETIAGSPVASQTTTLRLTENGQVVGSGGCNSYGGPGKLAGGKAAFGAIISTRKACAPELMAQEQAFFAALQKTRRYEARGDALSLLDAAGGVLVRLRRQ